MFFRTYLVEGILFVHISNFKHFQFQGLIKPKNVKKMYFSGAQMSSYLIDKNVNECFSK